MANHDPARDGDLDLERFAELLLVEKHNARLDSASAAQMKQDLLVRLEMVTNRVVVEGMRPDRLPEFEALLDRDAPVAEVQAFVAANVPDLGQRLAGALAEFRRLYLGL